MEDDSIWSIGFWMRRSGSWLLVLVLPLAAIVAARWPIEGYYKIPPEPPKGQSCRSPAATAPVIVKQQSNGVLILQTVVSPTEGTVSETKYTREKPNKPDEGDCVAADASTNPTVIGARALAAISFVTTIIFSTVLLAYCLISLGRYSSWGWIAVVSGSVIAAFVACLSVFVFKFLPHAAVVDLLNLLGSDGKTDASLIATAGSVLEIFVCILYVFSMAAVASGQVQGVDAAVESCPSTVAAGLAAMRAQIAAIFENLRDNRHPMEKRLNRVWNELVETDNILSSLHIELQRIAAQNATRETERCATKSLFKRFDRLSSLSTMASIAFALGVLTLSNLIAWPLSIEGLGKGFSETQTPIVAVFGLYLTVVVAAAYFPTAAILAAKAARLAETLGGDDPQAWLSKSGLTVTTTPRLVTAVATLLPLIAGVVRSSSTASTAVSTLLNGK